MESDLRTLAREPDFERRVSLITQHCRGLGDQARSLASSGADIKSPGELRGSSFCMPRDGGLRGTPSTARYPGLRIRTSLCEAVGTSGWLDGSRLSSHGPPVLDYQTRECVSALSTARASVAPTARN